MCIETCPAQGAVKVLQEKGRTHPFLKLSTKPGGKTEIDLAGRESGTFLKKDVAPHGKAGEGSEDEIVLKGKQKHKSRKSD